MIPVLSARQAVKIFEKFGWKAVRQKGSHIIMVKDNEMITLSVPDHKEIAKGTLRSLIRSTGLTLSEFEKYAKG